MVSDTSVVAIRPQRQSQMHQYVLDRSTGKSVKSPDAYALVPGNVIDPAGTYSLGLPRGADSATAYPLWTDDAGKAIPLLSSRGAIQKVDELTAQRMPSRSPSKATWPRSPPH